MGLNSYIHSLRKFRVWHRLLGISLAAILLISAITGILLAWKKDFVLIQPATQKGINLDLKAWKPLHELAVIATHAFHEAYPAQKDNLIDRMDVRPDKGIVKMLFQKGYWEVQIDATSGAVKSIARRHSDWIEHLHDGSIISDLFKLISMNILGFGILVLITTGFWLWYGPRLIRAIKKKGDMVE